MPTLDPKVTHARTYSLCLFLCLYPFLFRGFIMSTSGLAPCWLPGHWLRDCNILWQVFPVLLVHCPQCLEFNTQVCLWNRALPVVSAVGWESSFGVWGYSPGLPFSNHCSLWVAVSSAVLAVGAWAARRMSTVSCDCSITFLTDT